jgi:hypothetical protein
MFIRFLTKEGLRLINVSKIKRIENINNKVFFVYDDYLIREPFETHRQRECFHEFTYDTQDFAKKAFEEICAKLEKFNKLA